MPLSLNTIGYTVTVGQVGVIVLFADGTKWSKQSKVNVDAGSDGYEYSSFITLTQTDLTLFASKPIKKFRLYVHNNEVDTGAAEIFTHYVKCIKAAK